MKLRTTKPETTARIGDAPRRSFQDLTDYMRSNIKEFETQLNPVLEDINRIILSLDKNKTITAFDKIHILFSEMEKKLEQYLDARSREKFNTLEQSTTLHQTLMSKAIGLLSEDANHFYNTIEFVNLNSLYQKSRDISFGITKDKIQDTTENTKEIKAAKYPFGNAYTLDSFIVLAKLFLNTNLPDLLKNIKNLLNLTENCIQHHNFYSAGIIYMALQSETVHKLLTTQEDNKDAKIIYDKLKAFPKPLELKAQLAEVKPILNYMYIARQFPSLLAEESPGLLKDEKSLRAFFEITDKKASNNSLLDLVNPKATSLLQDFNTILNSIELDKQQQSRDIEELKQRLKDMMTFSKPLLFTKEGELGSTGLREFFDSILKLKADQLTFTVNEGEINTLSEIPVGKMEGTLYKHQAKNIKNSIILFAEREEREERENKQPTSVFSTSSVPSSTTDQR